MHINWELKQAIVDKFGSHVAAAHEMGIRESRLSYIVWGHAQRSKSEPELLVSALGRQVVENTLREGNHERR